MAHLNNIRSSATFLKDPSVSDSSRANTQPPIPKIILKRTNGQYYKIYKSKLKRSKMKCSKASGIKKDLAHEEVPVLNGNVDYNIIPIIKGEIIAIDSSGSDSSSEDDCSKSYKDTEVFEIDSSDEENETPMNNDYERYFHGQAKIGHCRRSNLDTIRGISKQINKSLGSASSYIVERCTSRENQNVLPVQSVITKAPATEIELVDLSSDEDGNNVKIEASDHLSSAKNRPVDLDPELGVTCIQRKKVLRDITHLSELMYIIINARRDYSARVLRSERLCHELTSKERTIAEENYSGIISAYGCKFTQLFLRMESRFSNINQDSFMLYNFIAYKLFVGINKIDYPSKISSELVKKLMLLLLKRNFHNSLVFEVFKEESAEDCLIEFESAFLDWSFPEAFIPIED